ncbi:MAG: glucose-6-phosphate dehydrogenase [Acidimicrobiia bacterium]|nr:glucose-6-phosphate dehydrogenase [Acidimicrobiia bacterium]
MPARPTLAILGASGDLTARLLLPALFRNENREELETLRIVGYALEDWDAETFRAHVRQSLDEFAPPVSQDAWRRFSERLDYRSGDMTGPKLAVLEEVIDGPASFYLALPPGVFAEAAQGLGDAGLQDESKGPRRLVIEKPFGTDLASSRALEADVSRDWREDQIFRIDHFLGKETTQNILVFRFANRFLEPVLNSQHVRQVQITASETLGLEGRYKYYDKSGAMRDMLQNHLMQLFTITAMEPPPLWDERVLRDHKVEVLKSVKPFEPAHLEHRAARGQYAAGRSGGETVPGYLEEPDIPADSITETYAAIRLELDTWRWKGVPFYMRSGKRLSGDITEIAIEFKRPPSQLFRETRLAQCEPNWLVFRVKPDETIELVAHAKKPGLGMESHPVSLRTDYAADRSAEYAAYDQLLLDVIEGDHTPFLRYDEVEAAWEVVQPLLDAWESGTPEPYEAGSDGPASADRLLEHGDRWRPLIP